MPSKRPTAYCDRCESTVYADDVHSCYDAKCARAVEDARDKVVEAAEAFEFAFRDPSDPWGYSVDAKQDELLQTVRALRAVRGEP
ncbi:MAG: hypothetical protein ACK5X3_00675 [Pseudomonadota bacterium]